MTNNTHTHSTSETAAHHGRHRRLAAIVVIAVSAWVGVHAVPAHSASPRAGTPGAQLMNQQTTAGRPEATTDWLARANR